MLNRACKTLAIALALIATSQATAAVRVAVATNFKTTAQSLVQRFKADTGLDVTLISGSTGKLYAQIVYGAPFDVLLAADTIRPRQLADTGHADATTLAPYAIGRLVLVGRDNNALSGIAGLRQTPFDHMAIANPRVAPYGEAALAALEHFGLLGSMESKLVRTDNVGQAFAQVRSGAAAYGLVALSLASAAGVPYWLVPQNAHQAIRQDMVVTKHGTGSEPALRFYRFMTSPAAQSTIRQAGYALPDVGPH